jgi:YlmC/YmxH family sporulation protein
VCKLKRCRIVDLRHKDVVNIKNGCCLGCVDDVEVDVVTAKLVAIVIYGRLRCFGILGRRDDIIILWDDIEVIGEDAILVAPGACRPEKHRRRSFKNFFK